MKLRSIYLFAFYLFAIFNIGAQNTTIRPRDNNEKEVSGTHKAMLIPFEPRLYMSEIDYFINNETKLNGKQIRHQFRDGLNEQLYKALKSSGYTSVDLMEDTVKYKKDIEGIYQYLTYEYMKVPDQEHYRPPQKEKDTKKIEKGQLNVETNTDARFMNAKVMNAKVVPLLYGKYKTDVFIFINQLEIKSGTTRGPAELGEGNGKRKLVVHYTVYTHDAKEINSGIAEEEFAADLNNPKKIIDKHFSKIATLIVQRINKSFVVKK